eukprot:5366010-Pleurochrysis_carterae.AAC.1
MPMMIMLRGHAGRSKDRRARARSSVARLRTECQERSSRAAGHALPVTRASQEQQDERARRRKLRTS